MTALIRAVLNLQFVRYILVGGSSASLDMLAFYSLINFVGIYYIFASVLSFFVGLVYGFFLQKNFTFRNKGNNHHIQFSLFAIVSVAGLLLNTFFLYAFVEWSNIYYLTAKVLAVGLTFAWNFSSQKFIVFKS